MRIFGDLITHALSKYTNLGAKIEVFRCPDNHVVATIDEEPIPIDFLSVESALRVCDCIAIELGGWADASS